MKILSFCIALLGGVVFFYRATKVSSYLKTEVLKEKTKLPKSIFMPKLIDLFMSIFVVFLAFGSMYILLETNLSIAVKDYLAVVKFSAYLSFASFLLISGKYLITWLKL